MTHSNASSSSVSMAAGEPHAVRARALGLLVIAGAGALVAWRIQRHPETAALAQPAPRVEASNRAEVAPPSRAAPHAPIRTPEVAPLARADLVASADPASPSYDPVLVCLTMEKTPLELFQREPRNAAFAGPREQALRERFTERLRKRIPYEVKVGVSCRTSSCEVTLAGGSTWDEVNAAMYALDVQRLVETSTVGGLKDERGATRFGVTLVLAFTAAQRDHAAYERVFAQHRAHDDDHPEAP
jgi:hypothetical protein